MSLLIDVTMSPALALVSAGEKTTCDIMNCFRLCRDEIHARAITMNMGRYRPGSIGRRSLQLSGNLFCVLLMPLEYLEAGLQQALEFGIAGRRD